ncbi:hypothetical protein C1Y63_04955 [Corynebacterium sp. 13CS0277]|uniref:hypothetical protein n=1 Tax=Corynebacterium sp. 13CS0277 TaxID=2071994 RepID=UPI000D032D6D|nr:hypothetical protein [Corynebacterium sp. 13CS0277]PRQ11761.1 hypothetical protein C1Y63_04955 [Corynebacterium sp. 13CS0277]
MRPARVQQQPHPDGSYTIIPNELIDDPELLPRDKTVYMWLRRHRDGWQVTYSRAKTALGISGPTFAAALTALCKRGWLTRLDTPDGVVWVVNVRLRNQGTAPAPAATQTPEPATTAASSPAEHTGAPWGQQPAPPARTAPKKPAPTPAAPMCYLPDDFEPAAASVAQVAKECPDVNVDHEHRLFTDHWKAEGGPNARKRDWDAAWRNWMRRRQGWNDTKAAEANGPRMYKTRGGQVFDNPNDARVAGWLETGERLARQFEEAERAYELGLGPKPSLLGFVGAS